MQDDLILQAYHYDLPEENIAQQPADKRDHSRLLVLNRMSGMMEHLLFRDILKYFTPGDMLVVNDTRVFPARLSGTKTSGGKAEVFLLNYPVPLLDNGSPGKEILFDCEALVKSSRSPKVGARIIINALCHCTILENRGRGKWLIRLSVSPGAQLEQLLSEKGEVPLPPYIKRSEGPTDTDVSRYQTIYADQPGAVAAPTAGLHFTEELLQGIGAAGIGLETITLHVGYGTFAPVQVDDISEHVIHKEFVEVSSESADRINEVKKRGGRIWAVGTTTARTLEFAAGEKGYVKPVSGWCDLYITPGFTFRAIDNLITNFHLPQSSLMFLVSAMTGRETLLACYREAISRGYRFYSYGDAMAIIR